jgi:hypothetical protein
MSEIVEAPWEFECPECGRKIQTTLGAVQKHQTVQCPGGHTVQLGEEGSGIAQADRALDDFKRSLEDM